MQPGIDEFLKTEEELFQFLLSNADLGDIPILHAFINELLSPQTSDRALLGIWDRTISSLGFSKAEDMRIFLRKLRAALAPRRARLKKAIALGQIPIGTASKARRKRTR